MSDIIAHLEVLSQESGCILDLSAILDQSICPKVDLKTHKGHTVEENDDYICVTPTEDSRRKKEKRCGDTPCSQVVEKVCDKNHVALDMEVLVILGLLTEEELEKYLKALGDMDGDDSLDMDNDHDVKMDPLLSLGVGEDKSILDAELLGPDGLLNVDLGDKNLLNLGGDGPLLNLGGKDKGLLGLGGVLRRRGDGLDRLADVDVITHSRLLRSRSTQGLDDLVDAQVGGKKDNHQAAIDLDVATHERRADKGLLDAQVGGEKNGNDAAIDLDILTHDGKNNGNGGSGSEVQDGNDNHHDPYYLSLYQPVCKKGFKKEHRDAAEHCHAQDANHCLAICHSRGALLTIEADAQVGDVANILLCAAVEFDNSESGDNCHYYVAPETEPCHDDQLEEKENCYTFVRN